MKKSKFVPQKEVTPIYLDQQGYEELLANIEKLKQRIIENNKGRRDAFHSETNDGCVSSEFIEIERIDCMLQSELIAKEEMLSRVIIVKKQQDSDKVNIGDFVRLGVFYNNDEEEEKIFKVVGGMPIFDPNADYQEISINSPIGKAIYLKAIGETCSYSVQQNTITVVIKEKVELEKVKSIKVKKLTK